MLLLSDAWCAGFDGEVQKANGGSGGAVVLMQQASERALLTGLLSRLRALDPDALVGHNLTAFDLDVLLHRLQAHKVASAARWRMTPCQSLCCTLQMGLDHAACAPNQETVMMSAAAWCIDDHQRAISCPMIAIHGGHAISSRAAESMARDQILVCKQQFPVSCR